MRRGAGKPSLHWHAEGRGDGGGGDYKRHIQPRAPPRAEALELKTKRLGGSDVEGVSVSCRHVPIQPQMTMTW